MTHTHTDNWDTAKIGKDNEKSEIETLSVCVREEMSSKENNLGHKQRIDQSLEQSLDLKKKDESLEIRLNV